MRTTYADPYECTKKGLKKARNHKKEGLKRRRKYAHLNVYVVKKKYARLKDVAAETGVSVSELMRSLIDDFLDEL